MYVPNGTYALTRFFPQTGITLRGQSRSGTVLQRYGVGVHAAGGFIHIQGVADVGIETLTLRGTGRRLTSTATGQGDDILINVINGRNVRALNLSLENAQGCGIQTEGAGTYGGRFEDISITNTFVRDNGYHGVALWLYKGTNQNTFRRITIDGADHAGVMIDAGTTGSTDAAGVNGNVFEDITILRAARIRAQGLIGGGFILTGGSDNSGLRVQISDQADGSAFAFGFDQSGIGSTRNVFTDTTVLRITSSIVAGFGSGVTGNSFVIGTGSGRVIGMAGNTFTNWPGLTN